jgi:hypothetical protein
MSSISKRIGNETLLITDHPLEADKCYTWSRTGVPTKEGTEWNFLCTGCRSINDKLPKGAAREAIPKRKGIEAEDEWIIEQL